MSQKVTLSQILMKYLAQNKRIEPATAALTRRAFRQLADTESFGPGYAADFQNSILDSGRNRTTANIYVKTIRPVLNWAVRRGLISQNPFAELRLFKIPKKRIRTYGPTEIKAMLDSANEIWRARILLGVTAGLRRSEVLNLTVDDIDFEHGIIYVQAKRDTDVTWRWQPKDHDCRRTILTAETHNSLIKLIMELPAGQSYPLLTERRYFRLLLLKKEGGLSSRVRVVPDENFSRPFQKILSRAKVRHGTFHDLRRTWVTRLLEKNLPPHAVREMAGHASIDTTLQYYAACNNQTMFDRARLAVGATGLEPATS